MEVHIFEGKTEEEVKEKALLELNKKEEEVFIKVSEEEVGLFKTKKTKIEVVVKEEVLKYLKDLLLDIVEKMGLKANVEAKIRDNHFKFTLFSDNNSILIGRNGRTIDSLQTILRYTISNKTRLGIRVTLDVENYKEKQIKRLEILGRNIAKEVLATGVEAKLDSMSSYERRIIHEAVSKISGVHTQSEGEEPNRYVVIKLNE
jgi:spoIIIJ-associated protein